MFVLLGEQFPDIITGALRTAEAAGGERGMLRLFMVALGISLALTLLRFTWVWVSLRLTLLNARLQGQTVYMPNLRLVVATSLAGVRGAITLAGILTLPLALTGRWLAIFLAAAVIIVSLLLATVALPPVLRSLTLPEEPAESAQEDAARHEATVAAIAAIEQANRRDLQVDPEIQSNAADRVLDIYRRRLGAVAGELDPDKVRMADEAERVFRLAALATERETILRLAREERLSDATARHIVRDIDLVEARYR
jgi:CPA1 family monovalent cation:H+ antiporter